jgi:hypothetical protein
MADEKFCTRAGQCMVVIRSGSCRINYPNIRESKNTIVPARFNNRGDEAGRDDLHCGPTRNHISEIPRSVRGCMELTRRVYTLNVLVSDHVQTEHMIVRIFRQRIPRHHCHGHHTNSSKQGLEVKCFSLLLSSIKLTTPMHCRCHLFSLSLLS